MALRKNSSGLCPWHLTWIFAWEFAIFVFGYLSCTVYQVPDTMWNSPHTLFYLLFTKSLCWNDWFTPMTRTFPLFHNQEYFRQALLSVSETQRWLGGARCKQNKTKTTYSKWQMLHQWHGQTTLKYVGNY